MMTDNTTDFSLEAANIRYEVGNQKAYLEALVTHLQSSLPGMVTISRSISLFQKNRLIKEIVVALGDQEFRLFYSKTSGIQTYIGNRVRGVILKTETISFQEWLQKLANQVLAYAKMHNNATQSLEKFLLGEQ